MLLGVGSLAAGDTGVSEGQLVLPFWQHLCEKVNRKKQEERLDLHWWCRLEVAGPEAGSPKALCAGKAGSGPSGKGLQGF